MSAGYVYLMRRQDGLYKIGRSANPKLRLYHVAREVFARMRLLATLKTANPCRLERMAHEQFEDHHVGQEWFRFKRREIPEVQARIQALNSEGFQWEASDLEVAFARVDVPSFSAALLENREAMRELSYMTCQRYLNGEFPQDLLWFILFPELLDALSRDARLMGPEGTRRAIDRASELAARPTPNAKEQPT